MSRHTSIIFCPLIWTIKEMWWTECTDEPYRPSYAFAWELRSIQVPVIPPRHHACLLYGRVGILRLCVYPKRFLYCRVAFGYGRSVCESCLRSHFFPFKVFILYEFESTHFIHTWLSSSCTGLNFSAVQPLVALACACAHMSSAKSIKLVLSRRSCFWAVASNISITNDNGILSKLLSIFNPSSSFGLFVLEWYLMPLV